MSKRCAQAAILPWLIMLPLGLLLALIGPKLIHQRKPAPTNAPAAPVTTPPLR